MAALFDVAEPLVTATLKRMAAADPEFYADIEAGLEDGIIDLHLDLIWHRTVRLAVIGEHRIREFEFVKGIAP